MERTCDGPVKLGALANVIVVDWCRWCKICYDIWYIVVVM